MADYDPQRQRLSNAERERNRRRGNKRALEALAALIPGFDSNSLTVQAVCTAGMFIAWIVRHLLTLFIAAHYIEALHAQLETLRKAVPSKHDQPHDVVPPSKHDQVFDHVTTHMARNVTL